MPFMARDSVGEAVVSLERNALCPPDSQSERRTTMIWKVVQDLLYNFETCSELFRLVELQYLAK